MCQITLSIQYYFEVYYFRNKYSVLKYNILYFFGQGSSGLGLDSDPTYTDSNELISTTTWANKSLAYCVNRLDCS